MIHPGSSPRRAGPAPEGSPEATCGWLLDGLATLTGGRLEAPPARLVPSSIALPEGGLPSGTLAYATGVTLAAATLVGWLAGRPFEVPETAVAVQVWLPEVMAASYRSPTSLRPAPPLAAPGRGWLAADLGAPGDRDSFCTLLGTLPADASAGAVARAAQQWRLAVCDYRRRPARATATFPIRAATSPPASPLAPASSPRWCSPPSATPLAGVSVCDLTAMWAGPLATWLLASLGAAVHKVEPPARPDGMRALDGGGIHPRGRQVDPGRDSAMWNALNHAKRIVPLDLRRPQDRAEFIALAGSCDVVIESFSPRVMPNFGLIDEVTAGPARPVMVAMPAFPPGPRRSWVAYGTGVHALVGLGDTGDGRFAAPAVSYPDPVAGLTAALAVLASLAARRLGQDPRRVEVALESACRPLLRTGTLQDVDPTPKGPGPTLLGAAVEEGLVEAREVAGEQLLHPLPPLRPAPAGPH